MTTMISEQMTPEQSSEALRTWGMDIRARIVIMSHLSDMEFGDRVHERAEFCKYLLNKYDDLGVHIFPDFEFEEFKKLGRA